MRGNTVNLMGNITADPDEHFTSTGKVIISFTLAWNDRRKDTNTGDYVDKPSFFNCKCFCSEAQAQIVRLNLVKGAKVAIEGHLTQESWEIDGKKNSKVVVIVDDPISGMVVQGKSQNAQRKPAETHNDMYSDDLPF